MQKGCSILVVDDEVPICHLLQKELSVAQHTVEVASTAAQALTLCTREVFDIIILDIRLPDGNGLEMLPRIAHLLPEAKIIMITGYADIDIAVTAMRNGAYDFVTKPFSLSKLELTVERACNLLHLERENKNLRRSSATLLQPFIGDSPPMRHVAYLLEKIAPTDVPVLLTGESGVGKDVIACAIHQASTRQNMPFVVKNCAGLQVELARSELFGHIKGAFTNAHTSSEGLITCANQGTLFLDEVGELSLEVQSQLLRVLESQRYRRVGEKEERRANVRFLFATNRNLAQEVNKGRFHEALLHRINMFQIPLPPLRERREDIPLLVAHFMEQLGKKNTLYQISQEVMHYIMHYHWPGNIRELRNVIERGIILAEDGVIAEKSLPQELVASVPTQQVQVQKQQADTTSPSIYSTPCPKSTLSLADVERAHIIYVLTISKGNKHNAAQLLGISRKTLYRKLHNLNMDLPLEGSLS